MIDSCAIVTRATSHRKVASETISDHWAVVANHRARDAILMEAPVIEGHIHDDRRTVTDRDRVTCL